MKIIGNVFGLVRKLQLFRREKAEALCGSGLRSGNDITRDAAMVADNKSACTAAKLV